MYSYLWDLQGLVRLDAIQDLPPFAPDDIHFIARRNCLRCPLAVRYIGNDGMYHTACSDVTSRKRIELLLGSGGEFIKKNKIISVFCGRENSYEIH